MHHLGVRTLTIGSRWNEQINNSLVEYLKVGGIEVVGVTTRGQTGTYPPMGFREGLQIALDVGREAAKLAPEADGVFVPGGRAMGLHVVPTVEAEFGKPVFQNTNVFVWHVLVHPGIIPPVHGWGKLLETP
jgi:maleate cis-trans isomerase